MPDDDLLRHVIGPTPYSSWWPWAAVALLLILVASYAAIFLVTMPSRRLRGLPVIGPARDRMVKYRFARAVHEIGVRYRAGELAAAGAGAAVSDQLRAFLHQATGLPAQYMQLESLAAGELAPAATVLADLNDAQFNLTSQVDVAMATDSAEELIRAWT